MTAEEIDAVGQPLLRQPLIQAVANILLLFGIFLSPFYIWSSGVPQISHIFLALGAAATIVSGAVTVHPIWQNAFLFCAYTLVINSIVAVFNRELSPLLSTVYYFFNLTIALGLMNAAARAGLDRFLRWCHWSLLTTLFLQTMIIVTGLGRTFELIRATGTFNDPNQLAHWLIWNVIAVIAIGRATDIPLRVGALAFAIAFPAVLMSASRSGFLGMSVVLLALFWFGSKRLVFHWRQDRQKVQLIGGVALTLVIGLIALSWSWLAGLLSDLQTGLALLDRFSNIGSFASLEGRGYDRIWKFPQYLIFGAGESVQSRWADRTWFLLEIHSTLGGVLFSYGVIGLFLFFTILLPAIFSWRDWGMRILLLAPLVYSLATYNLRNTMFWVGLALTLLAALRVRSGALPGAAELGPGAIGSPAPSV